MLGGGEEKRGDGEKGSRIGRREEKCRKGRKAVTKRCKMKGWREELRQ